MDRVALRQQGEREIWSEPYKTLRLRESTDRVTTPARVKLSGRRRSIFALGFALFTRGCAKSERVW